MCNFKDPELLRIAQLFSDEYFQMFHIRLAVADGKARKGDIEFIIKPDGELGKEGYSIKIANRITVSSPTAIGSYWGTRTLLQLAEQSEERKFPQGIIRDYPISETPGTLLWYKSRHKQSAPGKYRTLIEKQHKFDSSRG